MLDYSWPPKIAIIDQFSFILMLLHGSSHTVPIEECSKGRISKNCGR